MFYVERLFRLETPERGVRLVLGATVVSRGDLRVSLKPQSGWSVWQWLSSAS